MWLCRPFPSLRNAITIVQPDTVLRWHQFGFRLYWRWKSRACGGRHQDPGVRSLIRRMSVENPLWGAPRIHGELLKLGVEIAQSTVAKYMAKRLPGGRGQTWRRFCATMWPISAAWISLWCRRLTCGCCLYWSSCAMSDDA